MKEKKGKKLAVFLLAAALLALSVFGPERLAGYRDRSSLNQIHLEEADAGSTGYRYTLGSNEKLYLLSECLSRQTLPESEQSAMTRVEDVDYEELMGSYAFVVNRQGPSGEELTEEEIFEVCNRELTVLMEQGILPGTVRETSADAYSAVLYSAIDVLEPRNNLAVWKVSLSTSQQNTNKANHLIDAYIDADSGKIYSFYARTEKVWADAEPEKICEAWSSYLGLSGREAYETENPLLETTPYFAKYRFPGMGESGTIVTVGFYEGINEWFLKLI